MYANNLLLFCPMHCNLVNKLKYSLKSIKLYGPNKADFSVKI